MFSLKILTQQNLESATSINLQKFRGVYLSRMTIPHKSNSWQIHDIKLIGEYIFIGSCNFFYNIYGKDPQRLWEAAIKTAAYKSERTATRKNISSRCNQ